ncbi:MAG: hypothetical protein ACP5N7_00500 [Candidatus Pacearchaeota archaeon]
MYFKPNNRKFNECVRQNNVRQKIKISFWLDMDDYGEVELVAKDNAIFLNKEINLSKTFQDIVHDFTLDQKLKRQQYEIEDI